MSSVGIYGGTFDPIHNGHLQTAQEVLKIRKLDKIIFIPCFISPHKTEQKTTSAKDRLEMVKLAVQNNNKFDFSDIEIKRENISFSYETIIELKKFYKKIEFIIGYDNMINFHKWKNPEIILQNSNILVLRRKENKLEKLEHNFDKKMIFLNNSLVEISSTEIRNRIKEGLPINNLVPESVMEYIYNFNLYKE